MSQPVYKEGANLKAARGLAKIIAVVIVLVVAAFGDVMYIQAMSSKFPGGPLLIMCYIGAFTSFLAVGYLLMGKSLAFRPGGQLIGAWVVFVVELLIIAMNILLVFNPHGGQMMDAWGFISPASPVLHMIGVALLYFLDPELKSRHDAMEAQEEMEKAEREVALLTHRARIDLRKKQVHHVSKSLEEAVNSSESLAYIQQFGYKINMELLRELTGMNPVQPGSVVPGSGHALPLPATPSLPGPRGVPQQTSPLPSADPFETAEDDAWLAEVNARIERERAERVNREPAATGSLPHGAPMTLAQATAVITEAQDLGYPLDLLEDHLGTISSGERPDVPMLDRIRRLAQEIARRGYTLEMVLSACRPAPTSAVAPEPATEQHPLTFLDRLADMVGMGPGKEDDAKKNRTNR